MMTRKAGVISNQTGSYERALAANYENLKKLKRTSNLAILKKKKV